MHQIPRQCKPGILILFTDGGVQRGLPPARGLGVSPSLQIPPRVGDKGG